jgi:hypothetical protein
VEEVEVLLKQGWGVTYTEPAQHQRTTEEGKEEGERRRGETAGLSVVLAQSAWGGGKEKVEGALAGWR